ncbi:MAG: hypothetical protein AB7O57_10430 [Hyphomicrobiaceae bacterium]
MSGSDPSRLKGGIKGDETRAERLAAELRQNLMRRKQKARALRNTASSGGSGEKPDMPPDDPKS